MVSQFNILSDISYFNEHLINYWTHRKTNIDKTMTVSEKNCFSTKYFYQTINVSRYHCLIFPYAQPLCFRPVGTCTAPDLLPPCSDPPML